MIKIAGERSKQWEIGKVQTEQGPRQGLPRVIRSRNPSFLVGSPKERYPQRPTKHTRGGSHHCGVATRRVFTLSCPPGNGREEGVSNPMPRDDTDPERAGLVSRNAIRFDPRGTSWIVLHVEHIVMAEEVDDEKKKKKRTSLLGYTSIHVDGLFDVDGCNRSGIRSLGKWSSWKMNIYGSNFFYFISFFFKLRCDVNLKNIIEQWDRV